MIKNFVIYKIFFDLPLYMWYNILIQCCMEGNMVILGIDPGLAIVGWGVVEYTANRFRPLAYGSIRTEAGLPVQERLFQIHENLSRIIETYKPDAMAVEELFFQNNITTGIVVAEARGVILLAIKQYNIPLFEYTPLQVKTTVTGYGRAEKPQVMEMTRRLLCLKEVPRPDDTADALAIAICHAQSAGTPLRRMFRYNGKPI